MGNYLRILKRNQMSNNIFVQIFQLVVEKYCSKLSIGFQAENFSLGNERLTFRATCHATLDTRHDFPRHLTHWTFATYL